MLIVKHSKVELVTHIITSPTEKNAKNSNKWASSNIFHTGESQAFLTKDLDFGTFMSSDLYLLGSHCWYKVIPHL